MRERGTGIPKFGIWESPKAGIWGLVALLPLEFWDLGIPAQVWDKGMGGMGFPQIRDLGFWMREGEREPQSWDQGSANIGVWDPLKNPRFGSP